jgi:hypothetical protein
MCWPGVPHAGVAAAAGALHYSMHRMHTLQYAYNAYSAVCIFMHRMHTLRYLFAGPSQLRLVARVVLSGGIMRAMRMLAEA